MRNAMGFMLAAMSLAGCAAYEPLPGMRSAMTNTGLFREATQRAAIERSLTDETIAKMLDVKITARLPGSGALARPGRLVRLLKFDGCGYQAHGGQRQAYLKIVLQ